MADKMLRVGGRSTSGLTKPIQSDNKGNLKTISEMEYVYNDKATPGMFTYLNFEKRDTVIDTLNFPHVSDASGNYFGCFEQTICFMHSYNVPVKITLNPSFYAAGQKWLYSLPSILMEASTGSQKRLTLLSESTQDILSGDSMVKQVPELKQALPFFQVRIQYPNGAPTTGDLKILIVRRY